MNLRLTSLVLIVLTASGCEQPLPPVADQAIRPAKLFEVSGQSGSVTHQLVGRVAAAQTVDVSFEVNGTLNQLPLRKGQAAKKGALIAALDPTDFRLAVREAEVQLRLALQDLRRKQSLLQNRGIAQSAVDDAQATFELSEVRLAQTRERLAKTRITAPFDGLVSDRYVDNRTRVGIGDTIARLTDLNTLKVVVAFPESLMAELELQTPPPKEKQKEKDKDEAQTTRITAEFAFLPGEQFPLTFSENIGEANAVAQTFTVSFVMQRPAQQNILPGMTALVRIQSAGETSADQLAIPTSALQSAADGTFFVWLFDKDTQEVRRRAITVAELSGGGIGVTSGLAIGDILIAAGASQLQDGMRVRQLGKLQQGL